MNTNLKSNVRRMNKQLMYRISSLKYDYFSCQKSKLDLVLITLLKCDYTFSCQKSKIEC